MLLVLSNLLENIEKTIDMSRVVSVFVVCLGLWCVVLSFGLLWTWGDNDRLRERLEAVNGDADRLVDKVLLMEMELVDRDSLLLEEISRSEDQVMEYVRLRAESWSKAEALEDSIRVTQGRRDSLINRIISW